MKQVFRFYELNKKGNNDEDDDWKIENMPEVILDCTFIELVSINVKKNSNLYRRLIKSK